MSHASFPSVRYFWTAYKRACNFLYDTDKFINVQKHFKFIRTLIKSGLNYNDPRYKIVDDGKTYTPPQIIL